MSTLFRRIQAQQAAAAKKESTLPVGPTPRQSAPPDPPALPPPFPCNRTLPAGSPYARATTPTCGSPAVWIDAYGKFHCCCCQPPRIASQARRVLFLFTAADGSLEWGPIDQPPPSESTTPAGKSPAAEKNIRQRELTLQEYFFIQNMDRLDRSLDGLPPAAIEKIISDRNDFILAAQSGKIILSSGLPSHTEKPPTPPAGARVYFLTASGKQICAETKKSRGKTHSTSSTPDDATWMTWEGADRWYRMPPRVIADSPAGAAGSGSDKPPF